jgi:UDP-2-acetamido-3-amino-2,3-dideoxy-glucuronate N-acetyltransferase
MSEFGERLDLPLHGRAQAVCPHTGTRYVLEGSSLHKEEREG